jgi:allantoate deiminase
MSGRQIAKAQQVIDRCKKLASFTETPGSTCRTFLSPPMHDCHREITRWLEPLGADVRIDAAGNLRAFYPGTKPDGPRFLIGSHLDSVPCAGAYDGVLGVVLGVALLESLDGKRLPFGIEVVGFSEEEGVRFGVPFIGSRALVGRLDDKMLDRKDVRGISVWEAIEAFGLHPREIAGAALKSGTFGYLEFHIEQGPVLEDVAHPLGIVEAIAGQSRLLFTFTGRANHAGTTPMHLRRDAVACAAEWVVEVEKVARRVPALTATVGKFNAAPGAPNVIAGEALLTLDLRHGSDAVRVAAEQRIVRLAEEIAERRGLSVLHSVQMNQPSVKMDATLVGLAQEAFQRAGCEPYRMVSGAGHDAMILAEKVPAAMIFLRTPGGISHNPAETVNVEDVAKALECGLHLLDLLASSPISQRSAHSA